METHSSILNWEIPWTEEPGGLQSMGHRRVGNDYELPGDVGSWLGSSALATSIFT